MLQCIYLGVTGYNLKNIVFVSLQIIFFLANTAYPDEMPHFAAFHLGALFAKVPVLGWVNRTEKCMSYSCPGLTPASSMNITFKAAYVSLTHSVEQTDAWFAAIV